MEKKSNKVKALVSGGLAPRDPLTAPDKGGERQPGEEWTKLRKLARRRLNRFVSFEPNVLKGDDPDAIHDMRVASRRLQQVLDLLNPSPRPRNVRWLRRRIRRCRRALSEVRNCDVLLGRVGATLGKKRTPRREAWIAVRYYLSERRSKSFQKALRKLRKLDLNAFHVRCREYLASVGAAGGSDSSPALVHDAASPEQFCQRLGQGLERVWSGFQSQVAESHRAPQPSALHGVRIAAKRLRYLIEVIHAFGVPGSAQALSWLRGLQQRLGDWHDLEVLEQMMIEMVARPPFLRDQLELAMEVERLILRNRLNKKGYEKKYLEITTDAGGIERLKEWVGQVLALPSAALAKA